MRLHATSSAAHPTPRCFRTSTDGRIPLVADIPALWSIIQQLPRVVLQTRHASARLVAAGSLPALQVGRTGAWAKFDSGLLQLRVASCAHACGRLEPCVCCGSPGRIELLNTSGAEVLQLCAAPECSLTTWAGLLDPLAPVCDTAVETIPLTGGICVPLLSENVEFLTAPPDALAPLLGGLADANVALRCTLATGETHHEQVFCPDYVTLSNGLLTAHDDALTCQLALPAVTALAVNRASSAWQLHATGPGGTQLLTFSAAPCETTVAAWTAALVASFPSLR